MSRLVALCVLCVACGETSSKGVEDLAQPDLAETEDLAGADLAEPDLAEPDLLLPDLIEPDLTLICTDSDGDGHFAPAGCANPDCNDGNPNVWVSCGTCVDGNHDRLFTGCDTYKTIVEDCNDSSAAIGGAEILGDGIDQDCDGSDGPPAGDPSILYVSENGDDASMGTMGMPLLTLDQAVMTAKSSVMNHNAQQPFIFLAAGDYDLNTTLTDGISIYGGFDPDTWAPAGGATVIHISNSNGLAVNSHPRDVTLQNLTVEGVTGGTSSLGLQLLGPTNVVDCIIEAGATTQFSMGIYVINTPVTVIRSQVSAGPAAYVDGIDGNGADVVIRDSTVSTVGDSTTNGGRSHAVPYSSSGTRLIVSGSTINASGAGSVRGVTTQGSGVIVELTNNTINVNPGAQQFGTLMGVYGEGRYHLAVGNHINMSGGGGDIRAYFVSTTDRSQLVNNTVNISTAALSQHVGLWVYTTGADFLNNTVRVADGGNGYAARVSASGARLYNNLFVAGATSSAAVGLNVDTPGATTTVANNALYAPAGCAFQTGTNTCSVVNNCNWSGCLQASGNFTGDCGIGSSDFHIADASACQSTGLNPSTVSPIPFPSASPSPFPDLDGAARPQGSWDVGADEIAD